MLHTKTIAAGLMLALLGGTSALAQSLADNPSPAELPPASYSADQYVDSAGCVFIRAGIDGNVRWVPRVSRDRRQICGARPSLAQAAPAPAPAAPAVAPVAITAAPAVAPVAAPAPAPRQIRVVRQAPVAAPSAAPAPRAQPRVVAAAPRTAPAPVVAAPARRGAATCPNAPEFSQNYINDGSLYPVRCGPQALRYGGGRSAEGAVVEKRILPAHLLEQRRQASVVRVPEGYTSVWSDDRLNPHRGEQSVDGYIAGQYSWTRTVPRRSAGTGLFNRRVKEPRILSEEPMDTKAYRPKIVAQPPVQAAPVAQSAPRLVAKAPAAPQRQATAPARPYYVQLGVFGVEANAVTSAQRMARTGVPTRLGTLTRGSKTYRVVMAGPFGSAPEAKRALATAQRAGFADAYLRQ